jgi:hypothetical protein
MDDWTISVYMGEIVNQAGNVQLAVRDFNQAVNQPDADSVTRAFMSVQSILAASSMISKLLEPNPASLDREGNRLTGEPELQRQRTLERGKTLRKLLFRRGEDRNVLIKNSAVRNGFEHFDERLDAFIDEESQENRNIVDRNILPPGGIIISGGGEPKHLRRIEPTNMVVSVLDDGVNLQSLVSLIETIGERATHWLETYRSTQRSGYH